VVESSRGFDTLGHVSTKSTPVTSPARALRSTLRLSVPFVVVGASLLAAPAMADLPEQWEVPAETQFMDYFMLLVVWPLVIAAVLAGLVFVLNLRKPTNAAVTTVEGEWLGGPRTTKSTEPDKNSGGASGTW
jgi:hypothetical protein